MLAARCFYIAFIVVALLGGSVRPGWSQDVSPQVDPRPYGIDLPAGPVAAGSGQAVATHDEAGRPVVGRVHVRVGEGAVVLLPDGQLVARQAGQFAPTDRRFEPLSKDQLTTELTAEFPGFKTKTTNHYVVVHNASDEFALATSRILETMLPGVKGYAEMSRLTVHEPELPLVVVIYRTEDEFRKHRRMPEGVVAYYHTLSNRVWMYEQSQLAEVRPDLAIKQAITTIAHEGAHQILHNIGVQQRLSVWPMWLAEGLAEFFAPTTTRERLHWKGAGQVNDLRMFELEQYLKSKAAEEPSGELVEHTVLAARLTSTGYAAAWALTHYLARNRRSEFNACLRAASQLGPFEGATNASPLGIVRANRESFIQHFGEGFTEHERRLILHLKKQEYRNPFENAPHYVATFVAPAGKRPQRSAKTFTSPQLAAQWLRESIERIPAPQRARTQSLVRGFANREQAEAFAQQWLDGR